mgnify:CR=1 FL=1
MPNYLLFNESGEIISYISCDEEDIINQGKSYIETSISKEDIRNFYVQNEELIKKPENPYDYGIFNYFTKTWEFDSTTACLEIDLHRKQLLQESDWTDTVSAQTRLTNYAEWQTYRQALRDIPQQSGYPTDIVWPTPPA